MQQGNAYWARLVLRSLPPPHWTEEDRADALAEAFIRAYIAIQRGQSIEAPYAWFASVLTNVCLDEARRRKRQGASAQDPGALFDDVEELADSAPDPTPGVSWGWDILEALDRLAASGEVSDRSRVIWRLHLMDGHSKTEIARRFGVSLTAVAKHIDRVNARLAAHLKGESP